MRDLLTAAEVAKYLGIPERSLYTQRLHSRAPGALGVKVGKYVRWEPERLEEWIAAQRPDRPAA